MQHNRVIVWLLVLILVVAAVPACCILQVAIHAFLAGWNGAAP